MKGSPYQTFMNAAKDRHGIGSFQERRAVYSAMKSALGRPPKAVDLRNPEFRNPAKQKAGIGTYKGGFSNKPEQKKGESFASYVDGFEDSD
jgi:hypothetical protein